MDLGGVQLTNEKKAEVMAQVKQQIAIANLQETIQVISQKRKKMIVPLPSHLGKIHHVGNEKLTLMPYKTSHTIWEY